MFNKGIKEKVESKRSNVEPKIVIAELKKIEFKKRTRKILLRRKKVKFENKKYLLLFS
jgi:hypothetical protein